MEKSYFKISAVLITAFMFGIFFTSCEKDDYSSKNIQDPNIITKGKPGPPGGDPITLYTEEVGLNFCAPESDPRPYKNFSLSTNWYTENGEYVASASAWAYVEDDYPDNCYAKAQVMLVKNGQVYNGCIIEEVRVDGSWQAEATTGNITWTFPATTNLDGVSIVAQGLVWGCFGNGPNGHHAIHWAEDDWEEFNLSPPPPPPPSPPSNPTNLIITGNDVNLTWSPSTNADHYNIYRKQDYSYTWVLLGTSTSTSYFDFSVIVGPPESWFYYRVQAENNYGVSGYSNIVSIQGMTYH